MELLPLLLVVPIIWIVVTSVRLSGVVKRYRLAGVGGAAALLLASWLLAQVIGQPGVAPADYGAGDRALRAMLE